MLPLFKLNIYTPEKIVFDSEVSSLCVPEESGYMGVLAHHIPLISTLRPGTITFKDMEGNLNEIHSSGEGILEIGDNKAVLLLDSVS
jgi:F-type H+-transporting ATPase subunit epsilon